LFSGFNRSSTAPARNAANASSVGAKNSQIVASCKDTIKAGSFCCSYQRVESAGTLSDFNNVCSLSRAAHNAKIRMIFG
jgi:hypothetical protein